MTSILQVLDAHDSIRRARAKARAQAKARANAYVKAKIQRIHNERRDEIRKQVHNVLSVIGICTAVALSAAVVVVIYLVVIA